jgi:hypothetical protein
MKFTILKFSLIAALVLANGCASTTTENAPAPSIVWTVPTVGTTYTYVGLAMDSNHVVIKSDTLVYVVLANGLSLGGRTNVVRVSTRGQESFISYEGNGNISLGESTEAGFNWTEYPTGSYATISDPDLDTVMPSYHVIATTSRTGGGSAITNVLQKDYDVLKASQVRRQVFYSGMSDSLVQLTTNSYFFAPSLGLLIRQESSSLMTDDDSTSHSVQRGYGQKLLVKYEGK